MAARPALEAGGAVLLWRPSVSEPEGIAPQLERIALGNAPVDNTLVLRLALLAGVLAFGWYSRRIRRKYRTDRLEAALEEAERMRRTDPAGADKAMDEYFRSEAEREERERDDLRLRAPHDRSAAESLREKLVDELKTNHRTLKHFRKLAQKDPKATLVVHNIEAADIALQTELASLDDMLRQLPK